MKKSLMIVFCLFLVLSLSVSFASAGWFGDLWAKITGNTITGNAVAVGDLPSGLVAYWAFEDNLQDSSGNGNTGTWVGSSGYVSGKSGSAASFNGANWINIVNSSSLDITGINQITLSAWIYETSGTRDKGSIYMRGDSGNGAMLFYVDDRTCMAAKMQGGNWGDHCVTAIQNRLNTWHHVVFVYDGNQLKVYDNGNLQGTKNVSGNFIHASGSAIGKESSWGSQVFNGNIDELMVWNRALSASEVASVYSLVGGSPGIPPTNITCSQNSDCGNSTTNYYCSNNSACFSSTTFTCNNPGTPESFCSVAGGGSCSPCSNGCLNGACIGNVSQSIPQAEYQFEVLTADSRGTYHLINYGAESKQEKICAPNNSLAFFNGASYMVQPTTFSFTDRATFSLWTKRFSGTDNYILSSSNTGCSGGICGMNEFRGIKMKNNKIQALTDYSGSYSQYMIESNRNITDSNWHQIVFVIEGTTLRLYIDGVLDNTQSISTIKSFTSPFNLGYATLNLNNSYYYNGLIDELKIYNSVLSSSAIQSLYNSESPLFSCPSICVPSCSGKNCGSDGCIGTCPPGCSAGQTCSSNGTCSNLPCSSPLNCTCVQSSSECYNGGNYYCDGNLKKYQTCVSSGQQCGIWLAENCSASGKICSNGACINQTCTPKTCTSLGKVCGTWDDGCGNKIDCTIISIEPLATSDTDTLIYDASGIYNGFIASRNNGAEAYHLKALVTYDYDTGKTLTTIRNQLTGDEICSNIEVGNTCTYGNIVLTIVDAYYMNRKVTMTINSGGSFNRYCVPINPCTNACPLNNKCYPYGYRKSGQYCDDVSESFLPQKITGEVCNENLECIGNECGIDGVCLQPGFFEMIIQAIRDFLHI